MFVPHAHNSFAVSLEAFANTYVALAQCESLNLFKKINHSEINILKVNMINQEDVQINKCNCYLSPCCDFIGLLFPLKLL